MSSVNASAGSAGCFGLERLATRGGIVSEAKKGSLSVDQSDAAKQDKVIRQVKVSKSETLAPYFWRNFQFTYKQSCA
jgi:hypothetical protein